MSNNKILGSKRIRDNEENSLAKKIIYQNTYRGKLGRDIFFCGIWRVRLKKSEIENNFTFIETKKEYQTKIPLNLSIRTNNNKNIIYSIQIDNEERNKKLFLIISLVILLIAFFFLILSFIFMIMGLNKNY